MSDPEITTREQWLVARRALLAQEKELTRHRDAVNAARRRLPMVEITKAYTFDGPDGHAGLRDLFEGRGQLLIYHLMLDPGAGEACPACSFWIDTIGDLTHLHARDPSFAAVSLAPLAEIERYKRRMGWTFPWYSSYGSDFNYDFDVTLDASVKPPVYNYRPIDYEGEMPGTSYFLRDGDRVFHTYSTYARGLESLGGSYYFLDLTALGRQEEWEEPKGRAENARGAIPDFSS